MMDKQVKILPVKPTVKYDDFAKLDVRVGKIESVEDVEKSDKLVRLMVDFGDHKRKIPVLATPGKEVPNGVSAG